jgi:hypothetical protein
MTNKQFRENYKIIYGKLILENLDFHELLKTSASALTYIYLINKSNDYKNHVDNLEHHLKDFDIVMGMIDERNE